MSSYAAPLPRAGFGGAFRIRWLIAIRKFLGTLLTLNFAVFWAVPVISQGQLFRRDLGRRLRPAYALLDKSAALRRFAARHVYRKEVHTDYFAAAVLSLISTAVGLGTLFAWQIATGSLPWWLVALYYFLWVGPGGRTMATVYTFAHREGHLPGGRIYRPGIGNRTGNIFENWVGVWYGTVPYNFSTGHILLHHRLDGGKGDPIYTWDIDRTRFSDLMLYQWRMFRHMTGLGGLTEFHRQRGVTPAIRVAFRRLLRGMAIYWVGVPAAVFALLTATGSSTASALWFLFFVYFQPLGAMSCFLALINLGWHGFLEFDKSGRIVRHVASGTIVDGYDDSFAEDFHVAHHHFPRVTHRETPEHVVDQRAEFAACHGAIFERTTIFELAIMVYLEQFDKLVRDHYVDFANDMNEKELAALFEQRAKRTEMSYEEYEFDYLPRLRERVRELVKRGVCKTENEGYRYQALHHFGAAPPIAGARGGPSNVASYQ